MKIICTAEEKEALIRSYGDNKLLSCCFPNSCDFAYMCAYKNITCEECMETHIEWQIEPTDRNFTKADIDTIVKAINAHWELIIDEIRAEVEMEKLEDSPNFCVKAHNNAVDRVLQILDKYKAETEAE